MAGLLGRVSLELGATAYSQFTAIGPLFPLPSPCQPGYDAEMDEHRDKPGILFWSVVVATALAVYGGAYWALLDPDPQWDKTETVYLSGPDGGGKYIEVPAAGARLVPHYRLVGNVGEAIFSPAHWVDGKIRQTKWAARSTDEPLP